MSARDDMVIALDLGEQETHARRPKRPGEASRVTDVRTAQRRRSTIRRVLLARRARQAMVARRAAKAATRGAASSGRFAKFMRNPWVAAAAVAGAVGIRLGTGRTFENIGENIGDSIMGDLDDSARAAREVSNDLLANPNIARGVYLGGGVPASVTNLHRKLYARRLLAQKGKSRIHESAAYQVNGAADNIILRAREGVEEGFRKGSGWIAFEAFKAELRKMRIR